MRTIIEAHELLPTGLRLESLGIETGHVSIHVSSGSRSCLCPSCGRGSSRAHSRYSRTVSDLPWHGISVTLEIHARRFFCDVRSCEQSIFCERLQQIAPRARKTGRFEEAILAIVLELGGRAGARLAAELGLFVGRDALLGRIRSTSHNATPEVKVVGVDDFAFRKAYTYGTILVDLERHKIVDLLPDRSSETLAGWLRQNPGVETVSRDRSAIYAEGITVGAPRATQVADRWHLVRNLAESLDEFLVTKRPVLKSAAGPEPEGDEEDDVPAIEESTEHTHHDPAAPGPLTPHRPRPGHASKYQIRQRRYRLIVERWQEIHRLQQAGADVADIARKLGTSRTTVYRYKDLPEPPEFGQYRRRGECVLDPYIPYLLKRWEEGCRSGRKLFREIRQHGYAHSESPVGRLVAELRRVDGLTPDSKRPRTTTATQAPGPRHVASLLLRQPEKLIAEHRAYLDRLRATDEAVAVAHDLSQRFAHMVRNRDGELLDEWLAEAESCNVPALRKFAASLKKDLLAARAGLTQTWSNGPVEGFVHKLKLIKRQGYGRANFDLLRARVLAA